MIPLERLEELASRYVLGALDAEDLAELESILSTSVEARVAFGEFCMDEVLLGEVLGAAASEGPSAIPTPRFTPRNDRPRLALAAAALLLAFLGGWSVSSVLGPRPRPLDLPETRTARATPDRSTPLPIYYPVEAGTSPRLVIYPLDFDESGNLSTNPFVQIQTRKTTEL